MKNHTTARVQTRPTCDLCRARPARYDGKTIHGPWGYMCQGCFDTNGVGLGLGRGQSLVIASEEGQ